MNITENTELIERVKDLAGKKATGTPVQLACRLGVSERNLYRLIRHMQECDETITYSRTEQTYVLE